MCKDILRLFPTFHSKYLKEAIGCLLGVKKQRVLGMARGFACVFIFWVVLFGGLTANCAVQVEVLGLPNWDNGRIPGKIVYIKENIEYADASVRRPCVVIRHKEEGQCDEIFYLDGKRFDLQDISEESGLIGMRDYILWWGNTGRLFILKRGKEGNISYVSVGGIVNGKKNVDDFMPIANGYAMVIRGKEAIIFNVDVLFNIVSKTQGRKAGITDEIKDKYIFYFSLDGAEDILDWEFFPESKALLVLADKGRSLYRAERQGPLRRYPLKGIFDRIKEDMYAVGIIPVEDGISIDKLVRYAGNLIAVVFNIESASGYYKTISILKIDNGKKPVLIKDYTKELFKAGKCREIALLRQDSDLYVISICKALNIFRLNVKGADIEMQNQIVLPLKDYGINRYSLAKIFPVIFEKGNTPILNLAIMDFEKRYYLVSLYLKNNKQTIVNIRYMPIKAKDKRSPVQRFVLDSYTGNIFAFLPLHREDYYTPVKEKRPVILLARGDYLMPIKKYIADNIYTIPEGAKADLLPVKNGEIKDISYTLPVGFFLKTGRNNYYAGDQDSSAKKYIPVEDKDGILLGHLIVGQRLDPARGFKPQDNEEMFFVPKNNPFLAYSFKIRDNGNLSRVIKNGVLGFRYEGDTPIILTMPKEVPRIFKGRINREGVSICEAELYFDTLKFAHGITQPPYGRGCIKLIFNPDNERKDTISYDIDICPNLSGVWIYTDYGGLAELDISGGFPYFSIKLNFLKSQYVGEIKYSGNEKTVFIEDTFLQRVNGGRYPVIMDLRSPYFYEKLVPDELHGEMAIGRKMCFLKVSLEEKIIEMNFLNGIIKKIPVQLTGNIIQFHLDNDIKTMDTEAFVIRKTREETPFIRFDKAVLTERHL